MLLYILQFRGKFLPSPEPSRILSALPNELPTRRGTRKLTPQLRDLCASCPAIRLLAPRLPLEELALNFHFAPLNSIFIPVHIMLRPSASVESRIRRSWPVESIKSRTLDPRRDPQRS